MATLLYIHGFNSSPDSDKARQASAWLAEHHPSTVFCCPFLSPFPKLAMAELDASIAELSGELHFIGSSMGGYYATWLAEKYNSKAVLINPAVSPWLGREYLLGEQANYHTGVVHHIEQEHLDDLQLFDVADMSEPSRFLVLLQTGDEVLDYRLAQQKYARSHLVVERGGDHGFVGFTKYLPKVFEFLSR